MNWLRFALIVAMFLTGYVHALAQQTLRYNFAYTCNKERVIVTRCRRDSDQPGFPPTTDENNYCAVIYPDRPRRGGIEVETVELRSDIIKNLSACGAFQERQAPVPQVWSNSGGGAAAPIDAEVTAANQLALRGSDQLDAKNTVEANKYFEAAIVKYKSAIARGSDLYLAYRGLGVTYSLQKRFDLALPIWKKTISLKPGDAQDVNHLGIALLSVGQNADAIAAFEQAARMDPKYPMFHFNLATAYLRAGRFDDAHREAGTLSRLDSALSLQLDHRIVQYESKARANTNPPAGNGNEKSATNATNPASASSAKEHYAAAEKYFNAKDYPNAIIELQKVVALKPEKVMLINSYNALTASYGALHQYEKAIAVYLAQITIDTNPAVLWALGNSYFNNQQYAKAVDAFREAVRRDPNDKGSYHDLGVTYLMLGKKVEAMQAYNSLLKIDPEYAKTLLEQINDPGGAIAVLAFKSHVELLNGDDTLGIEYARTALRIKPGNPAGLLQVGEAFALYDHYDEAIAAYRSVIAFKPKAEMQAEAYGSIGQAYNALKQYTKAIPELKESLRLKPDAYITRELGSSYFGLKDYPTALATYQEAVRLKPDNADGHYLIGMTYAAMNQYDKSTAAYMEVVRLEPKDGRGYTAIGNLNFELKRYPDAGRAYASALRIDPKNKAALFGIGKTYLAVGRKPDAMRAYSALKPLDEKLAQELLNAINAR